jgi:hypothetical protein
MSILTLILILAVVVGGVLGSFWLGRRYGSPLTLTIMRWVVGIALLLALIALLIWTLDYFGVINILSRVHVPVPHGR